MSLDQQKLNFLSIELSTKISSISLVLIVFVLMIHSMNYVWSGTQVIYPVHLMDKINIYVQNFASNGFARVSVPFFFLISGFFFFRSFSYNVYSSKLKARFHTLLVPYIFWGSLVVFVYYILQLIPYAESYFSKTLIRERSLVDVLFISWVEPLNYPLWFLRELVLLVIVSPVIYYLYSKLKLVFFIVPFGLWLFGFFDTSTELTFFKSESFLFFSLGILLAQNISLLHKTITNTVFYSFVVLYFLLLLFKTWILSFSDIYMASQLLIVFSQLMKLMGIFVIWFLFDRLSLTGIKFLIPFTFLIFVFHEPMLTIFTKGGYALFGVNSISSFFLYFFSPILVVTILYYFGWGLMKHFPRFSKIVTGGRL